MFCIIPIMQIQYFPKTCGIGHTCTSSTVSLSEKWNKSSREVLAQLAHKTGRPSLAKCWAQDTERYTAWKGTRTGSENCSAANKKLWKNQQRECCLRQLFKTLPLAVTGTCVAESLPLTNSAKHSSCQYQCRSVLPFRWRGCTVYWVLLNQLILGCRPGYMYTGFYLEHFCGGTSNVHVCWIQCKGRDKWWWSNATDF